MVICCRCESRATISGESTRDCATYQLSFLTPVFAVMTLLVSLLWYLPLSCFDVCKFGFCCLSLLFWRFCLLDLFHALIALSVSHYQKTCWKFWLPKWKRKRMSFKISFVIVTQVYGMFYLNLGNMQYVYVTWDIMNVT